MTAADEVFLLARDLSGTPAEMAARIGDLMASYPRFSLDGATRREVRACQKQVIARDIELAALRHRMSMDFGKARGWSLTLRAFDVMNLSDWRKTYRGTVVRTDWPRVYADNAKRYVVERRPVGLVCHLYDVSPDRFGEVTDWAQVNGLRASLPDFPSWHLPGQTTLTLFEAMERSTS